MFGERILLCSSGWPGSYFVQPGCPLTHGNPPVSTFRVLGLQVHLIYILMLSIRNTCWKTVAVLKNLFCGNKDVFKNKL